MAAQNPFEALCELAARENWDWRILGTPGLHLYFRYGFRELALGRHPASPTWRTSRQAHHELEGLLGPAPSFSGWPLSEQEALISIMAPASIKKIAATANFPDWLGYLGLGLWHTQEAERKVRTLTLSWAPQLAELLSLESQSRGLLDKIRLSRSRTLRWSDLGKIEWDLQPTSGRE